MFLEISEQGLLFPSCISINLYRLFKLENFKLSIFRLVFPNFIHIRWACRTSKDFSHGGGGEKLGGSKEEVRGGWLPRSSSATRHW